MLLIFVFAFGYLFYKTVALKNELDQTNKELALQKEEASQQANMLLNEIDYQKSLQRPVILPKEKQVVFPEFAITLPYNKITKTLQYSISGSDMRVTSILISDHKVRQMSCSQLVRISTKNGTPYSPWEQSAGSIKFADGRTIYIIEAKAFKNNEASTEECETEVWHTIGPGTIAAQFSEMRAF